MAGVADTNPNGQEEWTGQAWTIGTRKVEKYWLIARPGVQLVFMNLRDAQLGNVYDNGLVDHTIVPSGGLVTVSYNYAKNDVISVLLAIINNYHPNVLRYQDTLPDDRYTSDHPDHFAAARFTRDAAPNTPARSPSRTTATTTSATRRRISPPRPSRTKRISSMYTTRTTTSRSPRTGWSACTTAGHAAPNGSGATPSGQPQAFVVHNGVVQTWWQSTSGTWTGPTILGNAGGPVATAVATITNTDGTMQVFARRIHDDHRLITVKQTQPNGAWASTWTDLGNPNLGTAEVDQVGVPATAANANGTLWLFVKDGFGGVVAKQQNTSGTWGSWIDLGGGVDVQDGLAAIRGDDGKIALFASTRDDVLKWRQSTTNGNMVEDGSLPTGSGIMPASPPSVTKNHDGTLEVIYREADSTEMVTTFQTSVGGSWFPTPVTFGGDGGIGQPALLTAPPGSDARIMVFERNDNTGVSMTKQTAPDSAYGSWVDLGGTIVDYPVATTNSAGAVVVVAIGIDGRLFARQQVSPGANSAFGPWTAIG